MSVNDFVKRVQAHGCVKGVRVEKVLSYGFIFKSFILALSSALIYYYFSSRDLQLYLIVLSAIISTLVCVFLYIKWFKYSGVGYTTGFVVYIYGIFAGRELDILKSFLNVEVGGWSVIGMNTDGEFFNNVDVLEIFIPLDSFKEGGM